MTGATRRRFIGLAGAVVGYLAVVPIAWAVRGRRPPPAPAAAPPSTTIAGSAPAAATVAAPTAPAVDTSAAAADPSSSAPTSTSTALAGTPASVAVICKEAWGGTPASVERLVPHEIDRLTVHHTAALLRTNADAPGQLRGHQRQHREIGWADLAYHYAIDANGNVYEGRPVWAVGDTRTDYDPGGHFLVVCEGNFEEQPIGGRQLEALADVLAAGALEYGLEASTIGGHRDYTSTACPGESLYRFVADGTVARMVEERLARGGAFLEVACGRRAAEHVAAVEAGSAATLATEASPGRTPG